MVVRRHDLCGVLVVAVLAAFCLPGCGGKPLDREAWTARGETVLKPFKQRLMGALTEALQDGPEEAIEVCAVVAPEIAAEISSAEVKVGRTSHKLRNPENAPANWMEPLLTRYAAAPGEIGPDVVRLENGGVGYVEPIYVKTPCLACHGSELSPAVSSRIAEHYPHDNARGFAEGDFRGLFWVEFREERVDAYRETE